MIAMLLLLIPLRWWRAPSGTPTYIDAQAERYVWAPPDEWGAVMTVDSPAVLTVDGPAVAVNGDWAASMDPDASPVIPPDVWGFP